MEVPAEGEINAGAENMAESVYILGAGRTDFRRNLQKEGKGLRDVIVESGTFAIASAGIAPGEIQSGIVGNFAAGLFTRQLHLGAMLTEIDPALLGIPTMHTEAACASGSVALLTGAQQIMGGIYDVVLVVGAEQQKTMSPADGADVLGAAADYTREKSIYGQFMFPKLFGRIAQIYMDRYGLSERQLAMVAAKNLAQARLNPLAQMRNSSVTLEMACAESSGNPVIAKPLKVTDCSQITDGAAAVVLVSERFAKKLGARPRVKLTGLGTATDHLALDEKKVPDFPIARSAIRKALAMAGQQPADLHGIEVHDCFSISEIIAYELIGLAEPGTGGKVIESGMTMLPAVAESMGIARPARSIPVNAGGGLIGDGHPVGATGVRQVAEIFAQLTQSAGQKQIEGARRMLSFNMGGSFTTSVAMMWEAT
jgi:acetyl-CoA C-acetyltransferase